MQKRFHMGERVTVAAGHPLAGKSGMVVRLRMTDFGAWVQMDDELPEEQRVFDAHDPRSKQLMLKPEECE